MLASLAHRDLSLPAFTAKGVIENADEEGDVVDGLLATTRSR
jgi:hypothetical protein